MEVTESKIIPSIIYQHASDLEFQWLMRDRAVLESHYDLNDLANLDKRLEANIDGLRIAGEPGWDLCKNELMWQEAGEVFVASVLALESGSDEKYAFVLETAAKDQELARGLVSAVGWLQPSQAIPYIQRLLAAESASLQRMGIAGAAVHRLDPGKGLEAAMRDEDPNLRARALQAIGELGKRDLANALFRHLREEEPQCRFHAAIAGSLLGIPEATDVLKAFVTADNPMAEEAARFTARTMKPGTAESWHRELYAQPEMLRFLILSMGAAGNPVAVPQLIEYMGIPDVARVAGESFSMITGIDLAYDNLEAEWPEGVESGPTEDPDDDDVSMDTDEDLPWPEPELIAAWWRANQGHYQAGQRYLCGQPVSESSVQDVLRNGFQRQRAAAAVEQVVLQPGKPLFETRAPGFRQQKMLGS